MKNIMYCLICFAIIQIFVTVCYMFIVIKREKSRINNKRRKKKIQNSQSEKYITHPRPNRINLETLEDEIKLEELDRFIKQKFPSSKNWEPMDTILSEYNGSYTVRVNYENKYYDIVDIEYENDRPKIK